MKVVSKVETKDTILRISEFVISCVCAIHQVLGLQKNNIYSFQGWNKE